MEVGGGGAGGGGWGVLRVVRNTLVVLPDEPVGTCIQPGANCDFHGTQLRLSLSSPLSPSTVVDVSLSDPPEEMGGKGGAGRGGKRVAVLRSRSCVGFNPQDFSCSQEWAVSHDGTKVPMTIMHRKDLVRDGSRPALLIVYGCYGQCIDTDFDVGRLVLMERGWSVVLCHVRGGGELGARWHAGGKGVDKLNSAHDLRACVDWVANSAKLSSPSRISLHTCSAGGLVVGAFLNMFQGLVGAAVVKVPFVDMANTMLDPSLPLTVHEYDEWGSAKDPQVAVPVFFFFLPTSSQKHVRYTLARAPSLSHSLALSPPAPPSFSFSPLSPSLSLSLSLTLFLSHPLSCSASLSCACALTPFYLLEGK
jgi:protease II